MKKLIAILLASPMVAMAADTATKKPNELLSFLPLILIVAVFYFFMIRPQMKQSKEQRNLHSDLQVGDEVHTQSGIVGKINKVGEQYVELTIADNTHVKVQKKTISSLIPKGSLKSI